MSPARTSVFALAEHLHMTVGELERAMTVSEYLEWVRYLSAKPRPGEPPVVNLADATPEDMARMFPS